MMGKFLPDLSFEVLSWVNTFELYICLTIPVITDLWKSKDSVMDLRCIVLHQWCFQLDSFFHYIGGDLRVENCNTSFCRSCYGAWFLLIIPFHSFLIRCGNFVLLFFYLHYWKCDRERDEVAVLEQAVNVYASEFERYITFVRYFVPGAKRMLHLKLMPLVSCILTHSLTILLYWGLSSIWHLRTLCSMQLRMERRYRYEGQ